MRRAWLAMLALMLSPLQAWSAAPASDDDSIEAEKNRLLRLGFELFLERQQRLTRITDAIRLAGAPLCGNRLSPTLGVFALTKLELVKPYQEIAEQEFSVDDRVRVMFVLPGHAGERGGLRVGDVVVAVEGRPVREGHDLHSRGAVQIGETMSVLVEREGRSLELTVPAPKGCYHAAYLFPFDVANAYADGARMVVYSGMLTFAAADDDLALIIGHELAHNVLQHPWSRPTFEGEADYLGAFFAARAGFDVSGAAAFRRRQGIEHPYVLDDSSRTHPSSPERELALEGALREIQLLRAAGEPLEPRRR